MALLAELEELRGVGVALGATDGDAASASSTARSRDFAASSS
jgi:hypothetical protein